MSQILKGGQALRCERTKPLIEGTTWSQIRRKDLEQGDGDGKAENRESISRGASLD